MKSLDHFSALLLGIGAASWALHGLVGSAPLASSPFAHLSCASIAFAALTRGFAWRAPNLQRIPSTTTVNR